MTRRIVILVAALLAALPVLALSADVKGVDVQQLERELRCPTCKAPLAVSDSPAADQIKAEIRRRAARGETTDQIRAALIKDFGREVLATPPKKGFDLVAWAVPALAVLVGLAMIPFLTRRWTRRAAGGAVLDSDAISDEERARLDAELRARGD